MRRDLVEAAQRGDHGFAAWATCFVDDGSVVVVLTNRGADPDLDVGQG